MNPYRAPILDVYEQIHECDFVHHEVIPGVEFADEDRARLPVWKVQTLAIVNCLVRRGTMLLFGPHGGGKTTIAKVLGRRLFGYTESEVERGLVRGHPQLTEEKILGSLRIDQLMRMAMPAGDAKEAKNGSQPGKIDVIWSGFVDEKWKIIDEVNRMNPYARDVVLSLLAEGRVKYYDQTKDCSAYTLFATMNPGDEGTFELPLPFKDRFGLAVGVSMPDWRGWDSIGISDKKIIEENYGGGVLSEKDLEWVQKDIAETVQIDPKAESLVNQIMEEYRICERVAKELSENYHVDNGLCEGCHWLTTNAVCKKVRTHLSVRVKQDLIRYSRALAWLLGYSEVKVEHVRAIAPYCIWHRTSYGKAYLNDEMYAGKKEDLKSAESAHNMRDPFRATCHLISEIIENSQNYAAFLGKPLLECKGEDIDQLIERCKKKEVVKTNLYLKQFCSYVEINRRSIVEAAEYDKKIQEAGADKLDVLQKEIHNKYYLHDYQRLMERIRIKRRKSESKVAEFKLTEHQYIQLKIEMAKDSGVFAMLGKIENQAPNTQNVVRQDDDVAEFKKFNIGKIEYKILIKGTGKSNLWKQLHDLPGKR